MIIGNEVINSIAQREAQKVIMTETQRAVRKAISRRVRCNNTVKKVVAKEIQQTLNNEFYDRVEKLINAIAENLDNN